jgi:hypothetical protein
MRLALVLFALLPATAFAQRSPAQQLGDPARTWEPSATANELESDEQYVESGSADAPGDAELNDRLRALDTTWASLASGGGPNILNIVLSLAGGAAQVGFGIAFTQLPEPIWQSLAPYFIVLGTVAIVRTVVVDIIMRPDARTPALRYQHMPSITRANRLARLEYGERELDAIAEFSFISRLVDAGLNVVGAGASLIAYFAPRASTPGYMFDPIESFIFIGPAISLILAIVTLASPTEAEQRRDAYHRMRRTMRERSGQADDEGSYDDDVVPPPPGARFSIGGGVTADGGGVMTLGAAF